MAGSAMIFTYETDGPVKKVIGTWTSDDTAGTASGTTRKIIGHLHKAITNPGTPAPTADYDITLTDSNGVNILAATDSNLTNRHTSNTEETYFYVQDHGGTPTDLADHPTLCETLTVAVANAGNSTKGVVILYVDGEILPHES